MNKSALQKLLPTLRRIVTILRGFVESSELVSAKEDANHNASKDYTSDSPCTTCEASSAQTTFFRTNDEILSQNALIGNDDASTSEPSSEKKATNAEEEQTSPSGFERLQQIADEVNSKGGTDNCAWITLAARKRIEDPSSNAVAELGGTVRLAFVDIMMDTEVVFGSDSSVDSGGDTIMGSDTVKKAFEDVKNGGDGTMASLVIARPGRVGHVILIANIDGDVGAIEGQGASPKVYKSADEIIKNEEAGTGDVNFGAGIVGSKPRNSFTKTIQYGLNWLF